MSVWRTHFTPNVFYFVLILNNSSCNLSWTQAHAFIWMGDIPLNALLAHDLPAKCPPVYFISFSILIMQSAMQAMTFKVSWLWPYIKESILFCNLENTHTHKIGASWMIYTHTVCDDFYFI